MARVIECIPARAGVSSGGGNASRRVRLAAYCRVSTNNEDQLYSFENQVSYYRSYAVEHPQYDLVDIYADEGITGTNTRHREQFKRMIQDCEEGKIDMVITKSVTRFARNTQDCLNYSRKLKDLGIGIQFEREGINTLDGAGELLFTILASLAQDESRSISENSKWGIRALFKQGKLHMNTQRFLGYDKNEKKQLVINPRQAEVVRRIFDEFIRGYSPGAIASRLCEEGVIGALGEVRWHSSTITGILRNEKHMGDAICQKTFTADFLNGRNVTNHGEVEKVYIKENHEPIVDKATWQAVQLELERRQKYVTSMGVRAMGRYTEAMPFSNRVVCGQCGRIYNRRTWTRKGGQVKVWQCVSRYERKGHTGCGNVNLLERDMMPAFAEAWEGILKTREERMALWNEHLSNENALISLRAKQMIHLTENGKPNKEELLDVLRMTLDHVVVNRDGTLLIVLLDGTKMQVEFGMR